MVDYLVNIIYLIRHIRSTRKPARIGIPTPAGPILDYPLYG